MDTDVSVLDNGVTLEDLGDNVVSLDASIVLNGNMEIEELKMPVIPQPKVLEMSCTAENITEEGSDVQTYSSKLEEHSTLNEEGIVVTQKNYEESAIRTKSVKTEEGEVSTTSHILMKENEKLHTSDEGTEVAEYNANCTEKHRSSVSSIETIGDQQVTRVKSSERTVSRNKTKVEEEGGEDTPKAITQSTQRDEQSKDKAIERNEEAATIVHRRSSTTKSERCETKIIGGTGEDIDISQLEKHSRILQGEANAGALIDLGALGEIKLGSTISEDGSNIGESASETQTLSHGLDQIEMSSNAGSDSTSESQGKTVLVDISALTSKSDAEAKTSTDTTKSSTETSSEEIKSSEVSRAKASASSESQLSSVTGASTNVDSGSASVSSNTAASKTAAMATHVAAESSQSSQINMAETKMAESTMASKRHMQQSQQEPRAERVKPEVSGHAYVSSSGAHEVSQTRGATRHREATHTAGYQDRAYRRNMATENGEPNREESPCEAPLFRPNDRKTADDLVKRILAESRQDKAGKKEKVKIDMGDSETKLSGASESKMASSRASSSASSHTAMESSSSTEQHVSRESGAYKSAFLAEAENTLSEKAVGAERRREMEEPGSDADLLDHRLGEKLEHIFSGNEDARPSSSSGLSDAATGRSYSSQETSMTSSSKTYGGDNVTKRPASSRAVFSASHEESHETSMYSSKGAKTDKDDFDELDQEINAIRQQYKESASRRLKGFDDNESDQGSDYGGHHMGYKARGRMLRQGYVEDDYGYRGYGDSPAPEDEEEFIPDEDFMPQRRDETIEVVKEKTESIRRVVDQQNDVVQKLRRASESFDELNEEIRSIKAQCIENAVRRSSLMDDDPDEPGGGIPRYKPYVPGSYVPGSYLSNRQAGDLAIGGGRDPDDENAFPPARSYGLARKTYGGYNEEDEETYSAAREYRSKIGRSHSLYDDSSADLNSYRSSASQYEAGEDGSAGASTSSSSRPTSYSFRSEGGYGSRFGSASYGSSDYGSSRLSYTSRFSGGSDDSSSYRPRYTRSFTLPDIESPYGKMASSGSTFTSRFLQKVRDEKPGGGTGESKKRDKPFKSRFLRKSFDGGDTSTSASSSYTSRMSSRSSKESSSSTAISASSTSGSEKTTGGATAAKTEE